LSGTGNTGSRTGMWGLNLKGYPAAVISDCTSISEQSFCFQSLHWRSTLVSTQRYLNQHGLDAIFSNTPNNLAKGEHDHSAAVKLLTCKVVRSIRSFSHRDRAFPHGTCLWSPFTSYTEFPATVGHSCGYSTGPRVSDRIAAGQGYH